MSSLSLPGIRTRLCQISQQPLSFSEARRAKQVAAEPTEGPVEPAEYRKEGLAKALRLIDSVLVKGVCLKDAEAEEEEAEVEEEKLTFCFNNNMFSP